MRDIVLELLAEKLMDEFYARDRSPEGDDPEQDKSLEQLKLLVPKDKWDVLFQVESRSAELCADEIKRFAGFVARLMLDDETD